MEIRPSAFWDDLARDLRDPEFLREYVAESVRIATIDRIVNELDAAREATGRSVPSPLRCADCSHPVTSTRPSERWPRSPPRSACGSFLSPCAPATGSRSPGRSLMAARLTPVRWLPGWTHYVSAQMPR
jgi:hypothetical protein